MNPIIIIKKEQGFCLSIDKNYSAYIFMVEHGVTDFVEIGLSCNGVFDRANDKFGHATIFFKNKDDAIIFKEKVYAIITSNILTETLPTPLWEQICKVLS